jgi:hypothetical protein
MRSALGGVIGFAAQAELTMFDVDLEQHYGSPLV